MFEPTNFSPNTLTNIFFRDNFTLEPKISNCDRILPKNFIIGTAETNSVALSTVEVGTTAVANTSAINATEVETTVIANGMGVGIDNSDLIVTGKNDDVIAGIAKTNSVALSTVEVEGTAIANTSAIAAAKVNTTAIANGIAVGIDNSDLIATKGGKDLVIGAATTSTSAEATDNAVTNAIANGFAISLAEVKATTVANGIAIGIDNSGKIFTDEGNDLVIGIADINASAIASTTADANATANVTNSDTTTDSVTNVLDSFAIGINNSGKIDTGTGDDRIIGYGTNIGILNGEIKAGKGNDYIHAAKIELDPLTGNISFLPDQTDAIKNAKIFGEEGNDFFEIGGFSGNVYLDGGRDRDILKLSNDIENYRIIAGSSTNKTLTFENSDSVLTVKNIEEFYLGNEAELYTFEDFV